MYLFLIIKNFRYQYTLRLSSWHWHKVLWTWTSTILVRTFMALSKWFILSMTQFSKLKKENTNNFKIFLWIDTEYDNSCSKSLVVQASSWEPLYYTCYIWIVFCKPIFLQQVKVIFFVVIIRNNFPAKIYSLLVLCPE